MTAVGHTSIKVKLGTMALTSLITFGLEVASKDSSFTLKIVFSLGFSWNIVVSHAVLGKRTQRNGQRTSSAGSAAAATTGAAAAAGIAISWILSRD